MGNEIGENGIYIFCTLPVKGVTYRQPHIFERPAGNRSIKRKDQSGCNNREEVPSAFCWERRPKENSANITGKPMAMVKNI